MSNRLIPTPYKHHRVVSYRMIVSYHHNIERTVPGYILDSEKKNKIPKDILLIILSYWTDLHDHDTNILAIQHGRHVNVIKSFGFDVWKNTCMCPEHKKRNKKHQHVFFGVMCNAEL